MDRSVSEQELIAAAQRDPAAFGPLCDRYAQSIYAFIFRRVSGDTALAQDLTASTFEKALRGLPHYRWRGVRFGAWIYQIARNEISQHFRRRTASPMVEVADPTADPAAGHQIDLVSALDRLGADDRELLQGRFLDELSTSFMAEFLGISPNALYVRLHRALERLRLILGDGEVSHAD
ncbi:MAG: sigma-70 family RNA polymerase sigma factor [Anaerolineales bacterium]|nr:sigma-70 family RNA polymerase sigma factor [Anaerolineales bacterium]